MYVYSEQYDIFLFDNDLSEYQHSDEGLVVGGMITYNDYDDLVRDETRATAKQLQDAFEAYWNARNDTGLHYDGVKGEA
ncbi:hypothetical protein ABIB48_002625 [Arthrobacter sp. UYCu511]